MIAAHPDEYQDGRTAGSLVLARRCWLELMGAGTLGLPQRFTFVFHCPSALMAGGLTGFLRYTDDAGFVRSVDGVAVVTTPPWQVAGTTPSAVWSLASLEHLFMRLRRAGARYDSALATLDLMPTMEGGVPEAGPRACVEEQ